ncbi:hypothetical protein Mapa_013170 [Marchantia paleacea]|nr:hypothetical protein Mapa_013170 [Marchantia paleacea]
MLRSLAVYILSRLCRSASSAIIFPLCNHISPSFSCSTVVQLQIGRFPSFSNSRKIIMAASASIMTLAATSVVVPSSLSSRSAFSSPVVGVAQCKTARTGPMTIRASAEEEPKAARREMLASLLAAGAVLVSTGNALAASGPGNQGAKRVAKKADELLKAGDNLINNDSPQRFGGPDGLPTGNNNIAQKAGSGVQEGVENTASKTVEGAKKNLRNAQARIDGIFGKKNNSLASNPVEKVQGGVNDLDKNGPGKVRTAGSKLKNDIASTKGLGKQASNKAGNAIEQAQDKAKDAVEGGKGVLSNLKDMVTDAIPQ